MKETILKYLGKMSLTQLPKGNCNKNSTENGNARPSIVVNNFAENKTTFKPMKPGLESYSNAVKSLKKIATVSWPAITCSKLIIETLEQGVKYVQT